MTKTNPARAFSEGFADIKDTSNTTLNDLKPLYRDMPKRIVDTYCLLTMILRFIKDEALVIYRIVICLVICALLEEPLAPTPAEAPAFFSNTFQNFKLSSAAGLDISCWCAW
jgi:hypothetical protein